MKMIEGLYYTKEHEWIRIDGGAGFIGITDYAQNALGDIAYVELPEAGAEFGAGDVFGVIESVKLASDLFMPVSGVVTEVNTALDDEPELLNKDAFENWIIKIEIKDDGELGGLLDAAAYEELIGEE